ncbi:YjcZ family sporulation protein [Priestia endophytica]
MSHGHIAPVYGYGYGAHHGGCDNFAIIVVLFILLIIIGACAFSGYKG